MIAEIRAMVVAIERDLNRKIYVVEVGSTAWKAIVKEFAAAGEVESRPELNGIDVLPKWVLLDREHGIRIVKMDTMFPNDVRFDGGRV